MIRSVLAAMTWQNTGFGRKVTIPVVPAVAFVEVLFVCNNCELKIELVYNLVLSPLSYIFL